MYLKNLGYNLINFPPQAAPLNLNQYLNRKDAKF